MSIPKDPFILLSYINTQLRDFYSNLDDLCNNLQIEKQWLEDTLSQIDYYYQNEHNQFV